MADKAYSSKANRSYLRGCGIKAVIPGKGGPECPPPQARLCWRATFDPKRYKERSTVERCFNTCKGFRAVAARYDKRERIYQGTIDVASIRIWLRDPVT
jgi:transposase